MPAGDARSGLPPAIPEGLRDRVVASPLKEFYLPPTRVVWQSEAGVRHAENLLRPKVGQSVLSAPVPPTTLDGKKRGALLLDFGVEVQGMVEIFTPQTSDQTVPRRIRIRLGESAAEAMAELGGNQNAGNDHAVRDQWVTLPWLGKKTVGPSGFRFVRIDAIESDHLVELSEVRGVLQIRDIPYLGSFACNDDRLNRIWQVGAYTVHLNMQDYLWDGIKRDRLVWLGDMHPEVSTINAVFGFNEVVPKSLDLIRDVTPPTEWMNGISSYSMWWIVIQEDWWLHHGDRVYLGEQQSYLTRLLRHLVGFVDDTGKETLNGMRFLDWPTSENQQAVQEGLQAMLMLSMQSGERLMMTLGDQPTAQLCRDTQAKLRQHVPATSGRKSPAALLALAGLRDPQATAAQILQQDGPHDLSTFYGFYVLNALAQAGEIDTGLDFIRQYWGGMVDMGATTFWEDFDLAWTNNAARIDQLVSPDQKDIHGDYGGYCYVGYRHSLCHGWASGPTAWLSEVVLGIRPEAPGCAVVRIEPKLGNLEWAEGTYPTPKGVIWVRHQRQGNGEIRSQVQAPDGVKIIGPTPGLVAD